MSFQKCKRAISVLLSTTLLLSSLPLEALAMTREEIESMDQVWIWESAHFDEITDEQQEQGVIYMGTMDATAEERGWYGLTIYRDGDVSSEATVNLSTVDVSATYGEDYTYYNQEVTFYETEGTIMELNVGIDAEQLIADYDAYVQELADSQQETMTISTDNGVYTGDTTPEALELASVATGKSTLALLKEAQTGEATRAVESDQAPQDVEAYIASMETSDTYTASGTNDAANEDEQASEDAEAAQEGAADATEPVDEIDETEVIDETLADEVTPEQQEIAEELNQYTHENSTTDMLISSTITVTFAAGQTEQYIAIEIMDDDEAEDDEIAMFILDQPEGALLGDVISMSMGITDDEEQETAYVGFTSDVTYLEGTTGEITLERTGADYYMVTADVSLLDADNQNVGTETCVFYPYETTATMELTIEGEGAYQAVITDLKACEAGNILATAVYFAETEGGLTVDLDPAEPALAVATSNSAVSSVASVASVNSVATAAATTTFNLTGKTGTNGASLQVVYTGAKDSSGNNYGYIYDTGVSPQVAVGVYYFPATFSTGYTTYKPKTTTYSLQGSGVGSYIKLQWYSSTMWKKGTVYAQSKGISTLPFATVSADVTMNKDSYSNNKLTFTFTNSKATTESSTKTSNFSRTLWNFTLDNDWGYTSGTGTFKMQVIDDSSGTPNTMAYLYGFAAFYSSFAITIAQPGSMTFMYGSDTSGTVNGKTRTYVPADASIGEGHETRYYNQSLQIISSTTDSTGVIRGNLIGYSIKNTTYSGSKDIWYLAYGKTTSDVNSATYSSSTATVKNLTSGTTVSNVTFNDTFLTNLYAQVSGSYSRKSSNALTVTPLYEYKDVTVNVNSVEIKGVDYDFTNLTDGTYHMGDEICLTAEAPEGYYYAGYEYTMRLSSNTNDTASKGTVIVSANDSAMLTLGKSNMAYYDLTPIFVKNQGNYIHFEAESGVYIPNTLTNSQIDLLQTVFPDYNFPNSNIYIADSSADPDYDATASSSATTAQITEARQILGQITVVPGQVYQIEAYTYLSTNVPTFQNTSQVGLGNGEKVTSNVFDFIALSELEENEITVGLVSHTNQQYYELTGEMFYASYSVRSSDTYLESVPAAGGTVYVDGEASQRYITTSSSSTATLSNYVERRSGTVDESGVYSVAGIYGADGDIVSVYYTNGDIEKVYYVTLGSSTDCTVTEDHSMQYIQNTINTSSQTNTDTSVTQTGTLLTRKTSDTLPIFTEGSPVVADVSYTYDSSASIAEFGTMSNSVAIMEDYFKVTATIDLQGNTLSKVVFKVDKVLGQDVEYTVEANYTTQSIFICSFGGKEMSDVFADGDKLFITMYDSEGKEVETAVLDENFEVVTDSNGDYTYTTSTIDIVYATVFTGLTFYIPTLEVEPQTFTVDATDLTSNVPVFGTVASNTTSGVVSFTKQEWTVEGLEGNQPYSLFFTGNANILAPASTPSALASFNTISAKAATASAEAEEKVNAANDTLVDDGTSASKAFSDSLQTMFKDNKYNFNLIVMLGFHYMYDQDLNKYVLIGGQVVMGGTFQVMSNFYTTISMVPVYLQLIGLVEVDLITSYSKMDDGNNTTITADDFSGYENIAEALGTGFAIYIHAMGKASVGVGICGVAGARGIVQLDMYGYLNFEGQYGVTNENSGFKVSISGGFAIDLIVFSISYTAEAYSYGIGKYATTTSSASSIATMALNSSTDDMVLDEVRMYNMGSENQVGGTAISALSLIGDVDTYTTLLSNAAERTRPQILQMNDGRQFMVYIGNDSNDSGVPTLYYTIYDGTWSEAKPVETDENGTADGTADTTPSIALYGDDVLIAWADATGDMNEGDVAGSLALFDISVCRYDTSESTMGTALKVSDDATNYGTSNIYADYNPVIVADPDGKAGAGILYIKRDTTSITNDEDLLDTKTYEAFVLAIWDGNDDATFTEDFISISGDPLVSDLSAVVMPDLVGTDDYLAMLYTIDKDGDYDTSTDQEIYLQFYNITEGEEKPAIPLTDNYVPDYSPQMTKLSSDELSSGEIFLTWLANHTSTDANGVEQTYLFHMDLQEILDEIDMCYGLDDYFARTGETWYYVTEDEFTETDDYEYDDSVFDLMSQHALVGDGIAMATDSGSVSLNEYLILEDDAGDLYMLWTNAGSANTGDYSVELYGAMYHQPTDIVVDDSGTADEDGIYTDETEGERSGWSQPIKLTNFGDYNDGAYPNTVLDEITACMDGDEFIIVSNLFTQNIVDNKDSEYYGKMTYGDNNLVAYTIDTSAQLEVTDMQANPIYVVADDLVTLYYTVYNAGLQPVEGYTGTLTIAGQEVEVSSDDWIFGGESVLMQADLTLASDLIEDSTLEASLTSGTQTATYYSEAALYEAELSYSHGTVTQADDGAITVPIIVSNTGNKASEPFDLTVTAADDSEGTAATTSAAASVVLEIPAIEPGETYGAGEYDAASFSNSEILTRTDFGTYGYAEVNLTYAGSGTGTAADNVLDFSDNTVTQVLSIYQPSLSLNITIGNNASEFYLEVGQTVAPATVRVGDDVISVEDVTITVADDGILSVSDTGYITTLKTGETTVTIKCTFDDKTYSKTVTVYVVDELYLQETEENTETDTETETETSRPSADRLDSDDDDDDDEDDEDVIAQAEVVDEADDTQSTATPSYEQFSDISETDWYADAVTYVVEQGLFNGVSEDSFAPRDAMTRAMLITVLWNLASNPETDLSTAFSDTTEGMWYTEAVAWAIAEGVTNGVSDTEFGPDLELTREQLVVLLYRFAGAPTVAGDLSTYDDAHGVSDWATDAMVWAVEQGIVSGTTATTLSPQSGATRAEVATMMMRYLQNLEG